jgi:hypothetical protein
MACSFGFGGPHKPLLLVGRQHGRTIPLADIPIVAARVETASLT